MSSRLEENELLEALAKQTADLASKADDCCVESAAQAQARASYPKSVSTDQWAIRAPGLFVGCPPTTSIVPPGMYRTVFVEGVGCGLMSMDVKTDELLTLPDSAAAEILKGVQSFWNKRDAFHKRGKLFKRGLLLYGPAGGGKTSTIFLVCKDIIERGGIVLVCGNFTTHADAIALVRKVEPDRRIVSIIEDIDEGIRDQGEAGLLSLLDGENQIEDVVHIATTNYPERLDPRVIKRPSRFDEVVFVDMPSDEARRAYIKAKTFADELSETELDSWVEKTEGMSCAFLGEVIVSVFCLGKTFEETLARLEDMAKQKKPVDTFAEELMGFLESSKRRKSNGSTPSQPGEIRR